MLKPGALNRVARGKITEFYRRALSQFQALPTWISSGQHAPPHLDCRARPAVLACRAARSRQSLRRRAAHGARGVAVAHPVLRRRIGQHQRQHLSKGAHVEFEALYESGSSHFKEEEERRFRAYEGAPAFALAPVPITCSFTRRNQAWSTPVHRPTSTVLPSPISSHRKPPFGSGGQSATACVSRSTGENQAVAAQVEFESKIEAKL